MKKALLKDIMDEYVHEFKGFGRVPSRCIVKTINHEGENLICFVDINEGTSVTNASEQLATEIVQATNYKPINCRFFEAYRNYETFDEIIYTWKQTWNQWEASAPEWMPGDEEIKKLFNT
jgi:hypothetical protein